MIKLTIPNADLKPSGDGYELVINPPAATPPPPPIPSPVPMPIPPTPTPTPTVDPNQEYLGNFAKPEGTVLGEKQNDGILEVTSGELKWKGGCWTSNSPTFRVVTLKNDFTDVALTFRARILKFTGGSDAYDGLHVFMRYRSQYHTYYVSPLRRDQTVALKKKCPGFPAEVGDPHGTYYDFTSVKSPWVLGTWYDIQVVAKNDVSDTMKLTLLINGKQISTYSDNGNFGGKADICTQIMRGGAVGLRSDNCEWEVKSFEVRSRFPYP